MGRLIRRVGYETAVSMLVNAPIGADGYNLIEQDYWYGIATSMVDDFYIEDIKAEIVEYKKSQANTL